MWAKHKFRHDGAEKLCHPAGRVRTVKLSSQCPVDAPDGHFSNVIRGRYRDAMQLKIRDIARVGDQAMIQVA